MSWEQPNTAVSCLAFNQDNTCFVAGTDKGFGVYSCEPFKKTLGREFDGGLACVEMLFRCNIMALVASSANSRYGSNKVLIWDDHQARCVGDLSFSRPVLGVRLRRDRIVVVLQSKLYVYNFADLQLVDRIETADNIKALCALCAGTPSAVLACPGLQKGSVRVELYGSGKTTLISAHTNPVAAIALNSDGSRVATASDQGTLFRIHDTFSGQLIQELRRGTDQAVIYSIAFNKTSEWLATSSDKGTVHVFSLLRETADAEEAKDEDKETSASDLLWGTVKALLPKYFVSERSFTQFHCLDRLRTLVAFGQEPNTLLVLSADGFLYQASFDRTKPGAPCLQTSYSKYLVPDIEL